jgi:hypothetical protein
MQNNVVEVKPSPNVYTVLILVAILAQAAAIFLAGNKLMADPPQGYGVPAGLLFKPFDDQKTQVDQNLPAKTNAPLTAE